MSSVFSFFDSSTSGSYFHETDTVAMNGLTPKDLEYCTITSFDDRDGCNYYNNNNNNNHHHHDDGLSQLFDHTKDIDNDCNQWTITTTVGSMDDNALLKRQMEERNEEMNDDDDNNNDQRTTDDPMEEEEPLTTAKRQRSTHTLSRHLKRPSDIIARGRELGIIDQHPEFEGLVDPDTRHWTRISSGADNGNNHDEVTIETRTRSEGTTMGTFPNMFSSLKYQIIHCITGSICDKYPRLFYRITAVDSESGEEIRKDMGRRKVIKGDTEGEITRVSKGSKMATTNARRCSRIGAQSKSKSSADCSSSSSSSQSHHRLTATSRIQFTTVSFHFGKKKFCLQISYYASRDVQDCEPIMVVRSADFDVFARRVSGALYQLEQKILEIENGNKRQKRKRLDALEQEDAKSRSSKKKKWTVTKPQKKREPIETEQQQRVTLDGYMEQLDKLLKMKDLLDPHERDIAHRRTMERLNLEESQLPPAQTQSMENLYFQLAELSNSMPIIVPTSSSSSVINYNNNDNNAFLEYPWDSLKDSHRTDQKEDFGT